MSAGASGALWEGFPNRNEAPRDLFITGDTVAENMADGTVVGVVSGIDIDPHTDPLIYRLVDDAGGRFALVNGHLVVRNGSLLDYEAATFHDITIRVEDPSGVMLERVFRITVLDVLERETPPPGNSNPYDLDFYQAMLPENASNGQFVGNLIGFDADEGDILRYELVDDAGGRFMLDGDRILVKDGSKLDFETNASHAITVRVSDQHGGFLDRVFYVSLENVPDGEEPLPNRAPVDMIYRPLPLYENSRDGTYFASLMAFDRDEGDTLTFELLDDADGRFRLEGCNLFVKDGSKLDFEASPSHEIRVRVSDQHGASIERTFIVKLQNVIEEGENPPPVNHAPDFLGLHGDVVAENASAGTVIGRLAASDRDDDALTFSLVENPGDLFAIRGGQIVVAEGAKLDHETAKSHTVRVRVSDPDGASLEKDFTIFVKDVMEPGEEVPNQAPTILDLGNRWVTENAAWGTEVGTLFAYDPDDQDLVFSLVDSADGRFALDHGKIVVADGSRLDFETQASHDVCVRVSDPNGGIFEQTFTIRLKNVPEPNDPPPEGNHAPTDILLGRTEIHEGARNGFVVSALFATDPDASNRAFTYRLIDDAGGRFAVNGAKLIVADGARLDYETDRFHDIVIEVRDQHGAAYRETVRIKLIDMLEATASSTARNDVVVGTAKNDVLAGNEGRDKLTGGRGNDVLSGGLGQDILTGSQGRDAFVFDAAGRPNVDRVTDFSVKDDTIHLLQGAFEGIGATGSLAASAFRLGAKAQDADDRVLYNAKTGVVSYDADGVGGAAAQQIATLKKGLALTHKDFFII